MSKVAIDFMQVSVFLTCLVLLLFFGRSYLRHHLEKWRVLVWGFILLSLVSAFQLFSNSQLFSSVMTSQGATNYVTAGLVVGYFLGGMLVLGSLVSLFLSLFKSHKVALNRLKQLICFKSLLSIANHFRDADRILKESLANFMLIMGYKRGVIFRSSFKSGELRLVTYWGFPIEKIHQLHNLTGINPFYQESKKSKEVVVINQTRKLPEYNQLFSAEDEIRHFACVPLKYRNRICGVMGIYDSRKEDFTYQQTQFFSNWGNILGIVIEEIVGSRRNKLRRDYLNATEGICELAKSSSSLEDIFPTLAKAIGKVIDFNYLCLSMVDKSGENMRRLTIGATGNLFLDKGISLPTRGTPVEYVIQSGEALLDDDVYGNGKFIEDDLLRALGVRSRLIVPLKAGRKVCATLTLGHMKHGYYTLPDVKWLNLVAHLLTILVLKEQSNFELKKKGSYLTCLDDIARGTAKDEHLDVIFDRAASSVTRVLPTTLCRIALVDKKRRKLDTKALSRIRSQGINLSSEMEHSLTNLPWHRLALESKRLMLVNQDDPESLMSQDECRAVMTDRVRSALLVPLVLDGESLGIISLGEERNWQRRPFSMEDMEFVQKVALRLTIAIQNFYLNELGLTSKRKLDQAKELMRQLSGAGDLDQTMSDLAYNLNDPLSSIIGSAELLRLKVAHLNPEVDKYTRIIERNANKIHKLMEGFVGLRDQADSPSPKKKVVLEAEAITRE